MNAGDGGAGPGAAAEAAKTKKEPEKDAAAGTCRVSSLQTLYSICIYEGSGTKISDPAHLENCPKRRREVLFLYFLARSHVSPAVYLNLYSIYSTCRSSN